MLLTDSTAEPLPLWLEPGPELADGLAGDGTLSTWDGVSETLQGKKDTRLYVAAGFDASK